MSALFLRITFSKVSESEVQVQQEEETPNIELPSAWTLDVVKKEQAS
jgi:hypothetical protein